MAKNDKRASKCTDSVIRKICLLIEKKAKWKEIAEVLSIGERTLEYWRNEKSEYYQPKLVAALGATYEKMSCEKTKTDQHTQSQFHTLKKVTRERMLVDVRSTKLDIPKWARRFKSKRPMPPPKMPPANYNKAETIQYAKNFLDLEIDSSYTLNEIRMECALCVNELTVEIFVKVKEEIAEAEPNQQAVKNVLQNCGPENERWSFEQKLDVGGEVVLLPPKITKVEEQDDENRAA